MMPTQLEENGSRSDAANQDDEIKVALSKNVGEGNLFSRNAAWGAAHDVVKRWKHLSGFQANEFLENRFNKAFDAIDVLHNGNIA